MAAAAATRRKVRVRVNRAPRSVVAQETQARPTTRVRVRISRAPAPVVVPQETNWQRASYSSIASGARTARATGAPSVQTGGVSGSPSVRGIFGNFAGDVLDTALAMGPFAELVGRNLNAAGLEGSGIATLGRAGVPGLGWSGGVSAHTLNLDKTAARAIGQDYSTRYGGLGASISDVAHGRDPRANFHRFALQVAEHPGLFALDVGSAWSGAGVAARLGSKALTATGLASSTGKIARVAERSILPEGASVRGGRVSTGARYRAPRVRELPLGENSPAVSRVVVPRRPYSKNPLTRGVQKKVTGPLGESFSQFLERQGNLARAGATRAEGRIPGSSLARPFSTVSRFNRVAARAGRDMRYTAELDKAQAVRALSADFLSSVRDVRRSGRLAPDLSTSGSRAAADAALYLHTRDLLDVPGMSPEIARQNVIRFMREGLDEAVTARRSRSKGAQRTIQAIADVPESWLRLETAPPALREAVTQARDLSRQATGMRVAAETISPETAAAVGSRPAEMVFGGSRHSESFVRPTERVLAARQALDAAVAARDAGPRLTPLGAARRSFSAGRQVGRGERNLEIAPGQRMGRRRQPGQPTRNQDYLLRTRGGGRAEYEAKKFSAYLSGGRRDPLVPHPPVSPGEARPVGVGAAQGRAYGQVLRGRAGQFTARSGMQESGRLARDVRSARHELAVAERQARGGFTPPTRTDVGRQGVYLPDRPVDRPAGRTSGNPRGAFGRLSQDKVHESHGTLFRTGNVSLDPQGVVAAVDRALIDDMHPGFVRTMVDTFAFREPGGRVVSGPRAIKAMEADPDNVVLASRASLEDAMRLSRSSPEGVMPGNPFAGMEAEGTLVSGTEALGALQRGGRVSNDLIALPKTAVDAVRSGYNAARLPDRMAWFGPWYDTPLQLWRRGILAFAPRWYLNNLFGNTLQFGLLTGGDVKAIFQARKLQIRGAAYERAGGSTIVGDVRASDALRDVGRARAGFERASDAGMNFNNSIEATLHKAAYISRAKRGLRAEGVNIRKMSAQDLARAIEEMPTELQTQVLREVELFMGDYVRMTPFEREGLRRVFPFYSWMRVIGKLMGSLPFRHPKRTALLALVSRASAEAVNPDDYMLPVYDRGRVNLPGDLVMRTMGSNPFATHANLVSNIATGDVGEVLSGLTSNVSPIGAQQGIQLAFGRNGLGRPFTAPPGQGGSVQAFGGPPMKINPATGLPQEYHPKPSIWEMAFQTLPTVPGIVRGLASGGQTPYDTTGTLDIVGNAIGGGGYDPNLFMPPRQSRPSTPLPGAPLLSLLGLSLQHRDQAAEQARYVAQLRRQADAERQTARRKARLRVR